jgi:hypothetical protein
LSSAVILRAGRNVDQSRGQGGNKSLPITTFAEDNVLMLPSCGHFNESILVHEVAHAVMSLGFDDNLAVRSCKFFSSTY